MDIEVLVVAAPAVTHGRDVDSCGGVGICAAYVKAGVGFADGGYSQRGRSGSERGGVDQYAFILRVDRRIPLPKQVRTLSQVLVVRVRGAVANPVVLGGGSSPGDRGAFRKAHPAERSCGELRINLINTVHIGAQSGGVLPLGSGCAGGVRTTDPAQFLLGLGMKVAVWKGPISHHVVRIAILLFSTVAHG